MPSVVAPRSVRGAGCRHYLVAEFLQLVPITSLFPFSLARSGPTWILHIFRITTPIFSHGPISSYHTARVDLRTPKSATSMLIHLIVVSVSLNLSEPAKFLRQEVAYPLAYSTNCICSLFLLFFAFYTVIAVRLANPPEMVVTARAHIELNLGRQSILPYCPGSDIGAPHDVPSLYTPLAKDEQYGIGSRRSCFQVECHCSSPELASEATRSDLYARPQNRAFLNTYRPTT